MGRVLGRLSAVALAKTKAPGMHADGGGLYLQVGNSGTKSWIFRYALRGKEREMGLGPLRDVSLAEARDKAARCRKLKLDGIDPIEARAKDRRQAELDAAKAITFEAAAEAYIQAHKSGWRNAKHADQWRSTLRTYAFPTFGRISVQAIDVGLVVKAIEPIWSTKTETASRVRGRIEVILDWASTRGFRQGDNPARWRGHLENLLPSRSKIQEVQHHSALPFAEIADFVAGLRTRAAMAARALEFLILTAARTGEVLGAQWCEFDLKESVWLVPAHRMKMRKAHRVPLSNASMQIVRQLETKQHSPDDYVFFGRAPSVTLSNMSMLTLLKRMERPDVTAHGFRSTFRDWAAECTSYASEVAEAALAHTIADKVEAAYRRGDLFEKRRSLMQDWADHCLAPAGDETAPKRSTLLQISA